MATKKKTHTKEDLVKVALDQATQLGWAYVTLHDIADAAGITLVELHEHFDDRGDILVALGRMIDRRVLEAFDKIEGEASARDRLFDVMMERFDVLNDYRDGVIAILHSFRFDPKEAVISCPHLCRSMAWMLEASGIETNGFRGAAKIIGLTGVYLKVLKTWKDDDSPDMGKTMAVLDKHLGQAESLASRFGF